jgi:serine/threonine protein kinase
MTSTTEGYTQKTPMYAAPEVHYQGIRRYSADVFSLGCCFAELSSLLAGESVSNFFDFRVKRMDYGIETHAFHDTLDLVGIWLRKYAPRIHGAITLMLSPSPAKRPTAAELQGLIATTKPELILCDHTHWKGSGVPQTDVQSSCMGRLATPIECTAVVCPGRLEVQRSVNHLDSNPPCPRNSGQQFLKLKAIDESSSGSSPILSPISSDEPEGSIAPGLEVLDDRARLIADKLDKIAQEVDDIPPSCLLVLLGDEGVGKSALVRSVGVSLVLS